MLIGNYAVLNKTPGRWRGGTSAAGGAHTHTRAGYRNTGAALNLHTALPALVAVPNGHLSPSAFILPRTAGAMSSRNEAVATIDASGQGEMGLNAEGTTSLSLSTSAVGQLIMSGVGTATVTLSLSGTVRAALGGVGTAALALSGSATIGAKAWATGQSTLSMGGALQSYAVGHMAGTTEESGLTPTGVANAVWARIIEAGFSAEEVMRLLAAHAAGEATGLDGGTTEFIGLDGSTVRIEGSVAGGSRTITARDGG